MTEFVVVLTTLPSTFDAAALAESFVAARLAACVNILPTMESIYAWKGELQRDRELQLVIKTSRATLPALRAALIDRHPYETPEFLVLPILEGSEAYLSWVRDATTS